jgi:biopolymer transport protein ExbB/TolQ|tara:strand:+ start:253 stop:1257 length:1005 start_codon:yes stop_codon:yes gene_type:complete
MSEPRGQHRRHQLSWRRGDIENWFGVFQPGTYTSTNKALTFIVAVFATGGFFLLVSYFQKQSSFEPYLGVFLRGANKYTTIPCVLLFFWAMVMLFFKGRKINFQAKALDLPCVPQEPNFFLNEQTAKPILESLFEIVDHPRHFILFKRIEVGLSSLQNIGEVRDVSALVKNQADNDEAQIASSYTIPGAIVWAVPILGFIGTVLGLSQAIGQFAKALNSGDNMASIKGNLSKVTEGLATAFETTLVALILALIIQLYLNFLQAKESKLLDECNEYCHQNIIAKLRLTKQEQFYDPQYMAQLAQAQAQAQYEQQQSAQGPPPEQGGYYTDPNQGR